MKSIKRTLRIVLFICFIVLAGLGIGLGGAVVIPNASLKNDPIVFKDEEEQEEQSDNISKT